MKSDLDHLPEEKQAELHRILEILHEEFEKKIADAKTPGGRNGKILKIILFGSYARGDWTEDPKGGYFSDFDLLVIISGADFTDMPTYWNVAEDRILRDKKIGTITNFIVHTLDEVNQALKQGQYFFCDIIEDGVMLYELKVNKPLVTPTPPDAETAYKMAKKYFEFWGTKTQDSIDVARMTMAAEKWNEAAFNLHQATERAYTAFLLTTRHYVPKTHNLNFLRSMAEDVDRSLIDAWPRGRRPYNRYFQLLKKAYTDARYSETYKIMKEELDWIEEHVVKLQGLVEEACEAHLEKLGSTS